MRCWLTHSDEIICLGERTVIPQKLQKQVLEHLQSAHQGITSMKARANQYVHWPEMSRSIKNCRYNCTTCGLLVPSHKAEPTRITPFPECLFQQICAELLALHSHTYLIIADHYSGWITIYYPKRGEATTSSTERIFRELFITFGVPDKLSTDDSPQFTADSFRTFLKFVECNIKNHQLHPLSPMGGPKSVFPTGGMGVATSQKCAYCPPPT